MCRNSCHRGDDHCAHNSNCPGQVRRRGRVVEVDQSPAGEWGGEQIEAGAITAGSLTHHRFMPLLHGELGDHVDHCVSILVGSAVLRLITSAVWAVWPQPTGNEKSLASAASSTRTFGALGAVTACWCFQAGHVHLCGIFINENAPGDGFQQKYHRQRFCYVPLRRVSRHQVRQAGRLLPEEGPDLRSLCGEDVACSLSVAAADAMLI